MLLDFRDDSGLLWELFERHYFVKSKWRPKANIISQLPDVSNEDVDNKLTILTQRREANSMRPIEMPQSAHETITDLKKSNPAQFYLL